MLIYRARDKTSVEKASVPVQKNENMHNVNQPGNDISKVGLFWLMMLFICPVLHCYITTGGMETLVK